MKFSQEDEALYLRVAAEQMETLGLTAQQRESAWKQIFEQLDDLKTRFTE